jgi:hypothetical protein
MDNLIRSRQDFENYVFDTLISSLIPDTFWDPVKVFLDFNKILCFKELIVDSECLICCEQKKEYQLVPCCNNSFCKDCVFKWFSESVKCPFCKTDLR